jgi:predicted nucleic acid-binding Zn ribbon protein
MATYLYETIPTSRGAKPKQYEIQQSMKDAPLTHHPETGEPIKRVIVGGYGLITPGSGSASAGSQPSHSCGHGSCGCH